MLSTEFLQEVDAYLQELGIVLTEENKGLYHQALTHSSYTYENKYSALDNYERLEFLGDAVLKLVVSNYLFQTFPYYREGEMTKIRSVLVSDAMLAEFCKEISLEKHLILGPAEARNHGRKKVSNLACAFESLLGAMYLDNQWETLERIILSLVESRIEAIDKNKTKDNFKAVLQEFTQAEGHGLPVYQTSKEEGPAHRRVFQIEVLINDEILGWGEGKSKKEAQQNAAKMALKNLNALQDETVLEPSPDTN